MGDYSKTDKVFVILTRIELLFFFALLAALVWIAWKRREKRAGLSGRTQT